jgi:hypothetical protein
MIILPRAKNGVPSKKKTDVTEYLKVFDHVGLLFNGPPGFFLGALHLVVRLNGGNLNTPPSFSIIRMRSGTSKLFLAGITELLSAGRNSFDAHKSRVVTKQAMIKKNQGGGAHRRSKRGRNACLVACASDNVSLPLFDIV